MNVKEVNNSIAQFLMGKNTAAQGTAETPQAPVFASLVAGAALSPDALIRSETGGDFKPVDTRPAAAADTVIKSKDRADVKNDRPSHKTEKEVPQNDRPVKENKRKDKSVPDAAAAEAPQKPETQVDRAEVPADGGQEAPAAAETAVIVQPREGAEPVVRELTIAPLNGEAAPIAAVMNGAEIALLPQKTDLTALTALAEVNVLDKLTGEVVTMSGAEFAARLQEASAAGQLFIIDEQPAGEFVKLIPAEVIAEVENRFTPSDIKTSAAVEEMPAPVVNQQLAEQVQILDAKLGGRKTKIDVDVKEEKFSYSETDGLILDKTVVDDAVNMVFKNKGIVSESKNPAADVLRSGQPQTTVNLQANAQNAVAAAALPTAETDIQITAGAAKTAAVEGLSSLNTAHQALNGAAATSHLRAEVGAKAEETSFRDIYKGMSREAVEQVKVNITKSAVKGVDKIEIQLKPEDLGHVQIKMQLSKDGKLQAEIIASRQDTLDILQKEADTLQKAFNDAGFDTDGGSFSFSFRGEEEQNRNAELRNFIGNVLEQESNEELVSNDNQTWDPAQGLNIRV